MSAHDHASGSRTRATAGRATSGDTAPPRLTAATAPRVLALQRSAGNAAVTRVLQRDIKPGTPLPNVSEIGLSRLVKRLTAEQPELFKAAFPGTLKRVAASEEMREKMISDQRVLLQKLNMKENMLNTLLPDGEAVRLAVELVEEIADVDDLTPELAQQKIKEGALSKAAEWMAGQIVRTAETENVRAVRQQIRENEWAALWDDDDETDFGTLGSRTRTAFARALRTLPSVAKLAQVHTTTGERRAGLLKLPRTGGTEWKDGRFLFDAVDVVELDDKGAEIRPSKRYSAPIDDGRFRTKLFEADKLLRLLIEPEILIEIPRPRIVVHPMRSSDFRAFQDGGNINVAADEPLDIIVHEIGHYVETNGRLEAWVAIQKLILGRHRAAGGGRNAVAGPLGIRKEGRFEGTYATTGKYTSKAYGDGSTEMMSMTLEYLANPGKFDRMVDRDPVQAAVVLRGLQPTAYAECDELRPFDKYLPS